MVTAVVVTGYWNSPFVFGLAVVISAAGFAGGIPLALNAAALCLLAVALPYHFGGSVASPDLTLRWAGELTMVAILAGYVRHLGMQASVQSSIFVGQVRQLSEVNDLLVKLRHAAQTLPVSLDLGDTLDAAVKRLRELFEPGVLVIMLRDEDRWTVAKASGARLSGQLSTSDLPDALRMAVGATATVTLAPLGATRSGVAASSTSALYVRLCARDELIGLVAVERSGAEPYGAHHVDVMETLAQQLAISCDNARWFARIGTLAAEQERGRIARDLHDRVGQSLALVGFELDRLAKNAPNPEVRSQTLELREHVRGVVSELREALYDLRTDVSEERDLPDALGEFLERVRQRSGLEVQLRHAVDQRLALTVEREVWRVAQEAVLNVERHAHATCLEVDWVVRKGLASLSVKDNGRGMPARTQRRDGYGILGMHERSEAIGASLSVESTPKSGTVVRLTVATERLSLRQ
ncbi:MAG: GAF domain-containing sensor histidine kinase [Acidimicrobiales bacterium]